MKNKIIRLIFRFSNFLIRAGHKLHIYIGYGVYHIPKYDRSKVPISIKEYTGDKKMFQKIGENANWYKKSKHG